MVMEEKPRSAVNLIVFVALWLILGVLLMKWFYPGFYGL